MVLTSVLHMAQLSFPFSQQLIEEALECYLNVLEVLIFPVIMAVFIVR